MSARILLRQIAWDWLAGLACFALLIAPLGCQLQTGTFDLSGLLGSNGSTAAGAGLFINEGDGPLLIAGRADAGAFFVFGTRDAGGNPAEIESILVQAADGSESFVAFESGRPVHIQGPDGSYAHIQYDEVSTSRLAATVELFDAAAQSTETYTAQIDLQQTAEQIADLVRDATGVELKTTTLRALSGEKSGQREVRITIFSPLFALFVIPLAAVIAATTVILGQVLVLMLEAVVATREVVLLAVFSPLFLIAELFNQAAIRIEFLPLSAVFEVLPNGPIITVR